MTTNMIIVFMVFSINTYHSCKQLNAEYFLSLEETADRLRKEAHSARQEEEGLMNDVETTGQAFEEMQEQNTRLLQQLREKDDANLKLMAERIRANQYQKKMSEERERTEERISSLQNQIEAQQLMISKLEETEKLLRQKNSHLEHQLRNPLNIKS
ncbi:unnamed protein product [Onchocerca flexuosa]|uniref:E3 ubiquitin protein ligase n=1 Tax=Onchocerca flexuosa TaxID=387005 RepID=A0A183HPL8_9BILA|nr:unnamed protein product [Onchocerca flexuosa]